MNLRIITWNLWDRNEHPLNAIAYATSLGADIICLQELPENTLPQLEKSSDYRFFPARDACMEYGYVYLGIMVHKDIECINSYVFRHEKEAEFAPIDYLNGCKRSFLESQSVSVQKSGRAYDIINCHLRATGAMHDRQNSLRAILDAHTNQNPVIACGDFNTMGGNIPLFNLFIILLFWARWKEICTNEITLLKQTVRKRGLVSLFENVVTYPIGPTWLGLGRHLDHILISKNAFRVRNKTVLHKRHKSDHHGLLVDLEV